MKNILKIETNESHETYNGIRINNHLINSGDPVVDWIDAQLYCNQQGIKDPELHESVHYFLLLSKWTSQTTDGLEMVVPYSMDKPYWQMTEIQQYYKQKKEEFNNNPFNKFM
jgi:hypothetical protein